MARTDKSTRKKQNNNSIDNYLECITKWMPRNWSNRNISH